VLITALLASCTMMPMNVDGGSAGGRAGGTAAGGAAGPFALIDLDSNARTLSAFAMAVDPVERRVVVAYFTPRGGAQTVTGHDDFNLNVVEWRENGGVTAPQTLRFMQRTPGVAVAIHPTTKEPTVAFLGGPDRFVVGQSIFWFQNDASLATRANGAWTEVAARTVGDVCAPPGSPAMPPIVGLFPALRFDAQGRLIFAYRDIQFAANVTDYTGSDIEAMVGPLNALMPSCVFAGFDTKPGRGARLMMVAGRNDETVLAYDQNVITPEGNGRDVVVQRFNGTTWTSPAIVLASQNTQTGPQVAYDSMEGYAVATIRDSDLVYRRSADAVTWGSEESVVNSGSGGWYPSLAFNPMTHEPNVAFYDCSRSSNVLQQNCPSNQDALRVTFKGGGRWQTPTTVDEEGGWAPKLGFFADGRRVIVYRVSDNEDHSARVGVLKLAIER